MAVAIRTLSVHGVNGTGARSSPSGCSLSYVLPRVLLSWAKLGECKSDPSLS
jgi:hypothetical protein